MAASQPLFWAPSSTTIENRKFSYNIWGSVLLQNPKALFAAKPRKNPFRGCAFKSPVPGESLDYIPKQFREENLKDGLMDNYKNFPMSLYGLLPSEMDMFMPEDNSMHGQAEKVTEESISSASSYLGNSGMWQLSGMNVRVPSTYIRRRSRGRRSRYPLGDLRTKLLHNRIVYLGVPIVPAVTELLLADFIYLGWRSKTKPIQLYINSPGTEDDDGEMVGSESDAYGIVDAMSLCQADVYTLNLGTAYGQAAMLLSNGAKGNRGMLPNSCTKLYLPRVTRSSGTVTDMCVRANDLDGNTEYTLKLLARGIGKPQEEIRKDIQHGKFFTAKDTIEYGIADKIFYQW